MEKFVIIDGFAILHRAYHAIPILTTKKGSPINAVYGLVSMILRVITDIKPRYMAVCYDRPEETFRKKAFKAYHANRPKADKGFISQIEKAQKVLETMNIPVYSCAGFEGDDVIGTLAKKTEGKMKVIIVTGDRDLLQLVDENTKVYMPVSGMSQGKMMGIPETIEKMGVKPELIPDYKALVGDPSDNYPGVSGIGPKTAITLIKEYGELKDIYKNIDKINPKVAEKLIKGKKDAILSHKLATIVTKVPCKISIKECGVWDVDNENVLTLFNPN
jgi:DNA polymerase-1